MSSKHRLIDTKFWNDEYILNLLPDEKLLFIYFLTTPQTNISGLYECPIKIISLHTGFDKDNLAVMLTRFEPKIYYINGWVYVRNFIKHQSSSSETVLKGIDEELAKAPPRIRRRVDEINAELAKKEGVDTVSLFEADGVKEHTALKKKAKKEARQENKEVIDNIIDFFQEKIRKDVKATGSARDAIKARLENYTHEQIMTAIIYFSEDAWRMKNNTHFPMTWFFKNDEQIEKWLSLKVKKPYATS